MAGALFSVLGGNKYRIAAMKIVSGGQTGVDRAALDAAMTSGVESGGWCPQGRLAEDGPIPAKYPVTELPNGGYRQRTRRNVIDSDGTAIICFGAPSGGTELTRLFCIEERRPHVLIDAEQLSVERASMEIRRFIDAAAISVMNVAGPRASGEPRAYAYASKVILSVLGMRQN
jgi:predicted Rossmann-fold nucleotide-binding protein